MRSMSSGVILDIMSALIFTISGVSFTPAGAPDALAIASSCSCGILLKESIIFFMASGSLSITSFILWNWSPLGTPPVAPPPAICAARSTSAGSMDSSISYCCRICCTVMPGGAPLMAAILCRSSSVMFFIMSAIILRVLGSFIMAAACAGLPAGACPDMGICAASAGVGSAGSSTAPPDSSSSRVTSSSLPLMPSSVGDAATARRRSATALPYALSAACAWPRRYSAFTLPPSSASTSEQSGTAASKAPSLRWQEARLRAHAFLSARASADA
mmetsp:Transcript_37590/g.96170  ORF Transcript_37590/g.96170 Transcript_37590/m.96170 type:complete len:273 (-) Transcript_37590:411-1229(-)